MNTINIHIDETLNALDINSVKETLTLVPHVVNVELNASVPHDLLVEYEAHHNMPVVILDSLNKQGLHPDIQSC